MIYPRKFPSIKNLAKQLSRYKSRRSNRGPAVIFFQPQVKAANILGGAFHIPTARGVYVNFNITSRTCARVLARELLIKAKAMYAERKVSKADIDKFLEETLDGETQVVESTVDWSEHLQPVVSVIFMHEGQIRCSKFSVWKANGCIQFDEYDVEPAIKQEKVK